MSPRVRGRVKVRPLWLRIERNRVRLAVFVVMFVACSVAVAEAGLFAVFYLLGMAVLLIALRTAGPVADGFAELLANLLRHPAPVFWWSAASLASLAVVYVLYALGRPPRTQLAALGARFAPQGEMLETKYALKEMALAAGFDPAPELFVLDSDSVNALCMAKGRSRPFVVVTRGLVDRFSREEQKAVFAHLLARLRSGDVHWATAVSALMAPVWKWRERDLSRDDGTLERFVLEGEPGRFVAGDHEHRVLDGGIAGAATPGRASDLFALAAWAWVAYMIAVIASEIVMLGHHRSHLTGAITADAEGMLLLKDPVLMLRTLRHAFGEDNRVRTALPMYAGLFYIWAGDESADESDPDWERIDRLREVVGIDGIADADAESTEAVAESMDRGLLAPEAPRLDESPVAAAIAADLGQRRSVEAWPDQPLPMFAITIAVMGVVFVGWVALFLLIKGSPATTRALLLWTPVVAAVAGLLVGRWWVPALFVAGGAVLAAASGMAPGSTAVLTPAQTVGVYAVALALGAAGALLNRLIFGSLGRNGR